MQQTDDSANTPDPALARAREARKEREAREEREEKRRIIAGGMVYATFMLNGYVTVRSLLETTCEGTRELAVLARSTAFTFDALWFALAFATIALLLRRRNAWALGLASLSTFITGLMLFADYTVSMCILAGW